LSGKNNAAGSDKKIPELERLKQKGLELWIKKPYSFISVFDPVHFM